MHTSKYLLLCYNAAGFREENEQPYEGHQGAEARPQYFRR